VVLALLDVLGQPLISTTLILPGDEVPLCDPQDIRARLQHDIDLIVDGGPSGIEPTTVIDLTGKEAVLVRQGRGSLAAVGLG
jgi:tRNA A37 threonylcarbamoyladenosine synthetase subunit TsaC/SUA5/YrdC